MDFNTYRPILPYNLFINQVKTQLALNLLSPCQKQNPDNSPRELGHHKSKSPAHFPHHSGSNSGAKLPQSPPIHPHLARGLPLGKPMTTALCEFDALWPETGDDGEKHLCLF